jgi:hypothetical protein
MSFKNAVANSLLMFVAATCVVLIVKAVSQKQSASINQNDGGASAIAMQDGVKVCYFHSNTRCPTCQTIEAYAKEAVETGFVDQLKNGKILWQVINYESPGNEHFATDYQVVAPNVVLVKFKDGKQESWKGLPEVWEHVGDKPAFISFVQNNLREFLAGAQEASPAAVNPANPQADSQSPPLPLPE